MMHFPAHRTTLLLSVALLLLSGCTGGNAVRKKGAAAYEPRREPTVTNQPRLEPKADHVALARQLIDQGHYDVALVQLEQARRKADRTTEIDHLMGVCHRESGDLTAAVDAFQKAITQDPQYAPAYGGLGLTLAQKEGIDSSLPYFEHALKLNPAKADVCNNLGYALLKSGRLAKAERVLRKCIAIDPGFSVARNNLAVCLGLRGKDDQALRLLLQTQPPALALRNLSAIVRRRGDAVKADKLMERAREAETHIPLSGTR